jgi:hypothetical protein
MTVDVAEHAARPLFARQAIEVDAMPCEIGRDVGNCPCLTPDRLERKRLLPIRLIPLVDNELDSRGGCCMMIVKC